MEPRKHGARNISAPLLSVHRGTGQPGRGHLARFAGFYVVEHPPYAVCLPAFDHLERRGAVKGAVGFLEPATDFARFHDATQSIQQSIHFGESPLCRSRWLLAAGPLRDGADRKASHPAQGLLPKSESLCEPLHDMRRLHPSRLDTGGPRTWRAGINAPRSRLLSTRLSGWRPGLFHTENLRLCRAYCKHNCMHICMIFYDSHSRRLGRKSSEHRSLAYLHPASQLQILRKIDNIHALPNPCRGHQHRFHA
jgi:hypothetical protein